MKSIGIRRHARALRKELRFWQKPGITRAQAFRVDRYAPYIVDAARAANLSPESRILDVGCGPLCCAAAVVWGRKWYVDPLLDEYRKIRALPDGEHLSMAIEDAPLPPDSFDLAICVNALDHVRDPWKTLEVIRRALKPGGVFLCAVYTRGPWIAFLRNLQESLGLSTDVAHPYSFTIESVSDALRGAGFDFDAPRVIEHDRARSEMVWQCVKPAARQE